MKKDHFLLIIGAMILVSAIFLRAVQLFDQNKEVVNIPEPPVISREPVINNQLATTSDSQAAIPIATSTVAVSVFSPAAGTTVASPLAISGQAPGSWFFEATLPIKLIAADGTEIVSHYGQAMSDWMVPGLVPFTSILEFTTTATSGYLVISKDNPSGLPENDDSFLVPVNF